MGYGKKNQINLLGLDSDGENIINTQHMKVCVVGQLKPKFLLEVNTELDEVIEVKARILDKLGIINPDEGKKCHPLLSKIKLFSLKGGIELMNSDMLE